MQRQRSKVLATLALVAALGVPASVSAQTTLTADTWYQFSWSGLGSISQTFLATTGTLLVVDCCIVGDMFEVFAGGSSVGTTSTVSASSGVQSGAFDGASAWAYSGLSKGMFSVGAGQTISLSTVQLADGYPGGAGYIMSSSVPEPSAILLVAFGILGLVYTARRRQVWSA